MPTPYDESILRSLRKISRAVDLYSRQLAARYQLTTPQLTCLRQLERCGTLTSGELASEVALSQATVTGILDRLESRGLVRRRRDERDKRRVLVGITARGRQLVDRAPVPLQKQFADRLSRLAEGEQSEIDAVLRRIVEMMSADDIEAAPVMTPGPTTVQAEQLVEFLSPEPPADEEKAATDPQAATPASE
jgi:DNA-binding MarR family transcriptional regulator